jgi:hypothetical protein
MLVGLEARLHFAAPCASAVDSVADNERGNQPCLRRQPLFAGGALAPLDG